MLHFFTILGTLCMILSLLSKLAFKRSRGFSYWTSCLLINLLSSPYGTPVISESKDQEFSSRGPFPGLPTFPILSGRPDFLSTKFSCSDFFIFLFGCYFEVEWRSEDRISWICLHHQVHRPPCLSEMLFALQLSTFGFILGKISVTGRTLPINAERGSLVTWNSWKIVVHKLINEELRLN